MIETLVQFGSLGMFIAAFLAGSFFPFSSEAVMLALMALGVNPWELMLYGTAGNVLGSLFNYTVGRMGKEEWFEKYLHVKPEQMDKARKFMRGRGAYMGFFAFIPILGSAITILLGLMRANFVITFVSITVGKLVRYIILIYGAYMVNWLVTQITGG
ncbi:MAG: VTT domain-containing protein [Prevotella sp.]|nr:VTT domain-containing protein [Prevotella sp.]